MIAGALRVKMGAHAGDNMTKHLGLLFGQSLLGGGIIVFCVYMVETVYIDWVEVKDFGEGYRPSLIEKMQHNIWTMQGSRSIEQ